MGIDVTAAPPPTPAFVCAFAEMPVYPHTKPVGMGVEP